jgi:predicted dithiol-disulfide oxidoreductase (DUF899 family)
MMALPDVASSGEWRKARLELLAHEKELTRHQTAINAERRRLPMVRIDKKYVFEGPDGPVELKDLFGDSRQLIIQHVMLGHDWDDACPGCTAGVDELAPGHLRHLSSRDTAFALVSRAPFAKIAEVKERKGWFTPWYSAYGTDFNYDFQVSLDESRGQVEYNYRAEPGLLGGDRSSEMSGMSCFLRDGANVFHTYSTYARGTEFLGNTYTFLDMTALGRQEDWEEPKDRVPAVRGGDPTFTD